MKTKVTNLNFCGDILPYDKLEQADNTEHKNLVTCGKNSNITEQHVGGYFVPKLRVCIMPVNYMLNVLVK